MTYSLESENPGEGNEADLSFGNEELIAAISSHIEGTIGPVSSVLHEIISPLVHVDLHIVAPGKDRHFWLIVTSGMSEQPQRVPAGDDEFKHVELCAMIPADWPGKSDLSEDPRFAWAASAMKMIARYPHATGAFVGYGHTLDFALHAKTGGMPDSPFTGALLYEPRGVNPTFRTLLLDDRRILFLQLVPLFPDEVEYKLKKGSKALSDRVKRFDAPAHDLFKFDRPKMARLHRFGLF